MICLNMDCGLKLIVYLSISRSRNENHLVEAPIAAPRERRVKKNQ